MVEFAHPVLPAASMRAGELHAARAARGFMPDAEGLVLHRAAMAVARRGPLLEVGGYCGKSAIYLGAAARACHSMLFSVDHHRGSEEQQPGEAYSDPAVIDPETGRVDTLPHFRRAVAAAGLEDWVIAVVGCSQAVSPRWSTPLSLLFIDGGHSGAAVTADYAGFSSKVVDGGLLVFHDVFPDPADGGQAPFRVYERARADGFSDVCAEGSLRVLRAPARSHRR